MILQFSFGNILSFKEQASLSMVASSLKEPRLDNDGVMMMGDTNLGVLCSAVVFGANASGKSNVIKAFQFFRDFIIGSFKNVQAGEPIPVENFRLSTATIDDPSSFELVFLCKGNQYRYGFEADHQAVRREWLYRKACRKRAKEVELFFREGESTQVHTTYGMMQDIVNRKMVRNNALCLSVAAQLNDPTAAEIMQWMTGTAVVSCSDEDTMWRDAIRHFDDEQMRQRIVAFSKYADLGIDNIEKNGNNLQSVHTQYDADGNAMKSIIFPFAENESEGTVKYFALAYPIIHALDTGERLVVDEFDSKLHPLLTSSIIALFSSVETNPLHAQLIFTTHDSNLLGTNLFRRDQIWFTEKDRYGASSLYSLAEYKVRGGAAFERDYLSGRYGATPIIGNLASIFTNKEKNA